MKYLWMMIFLISIPITSLDAHPILCDDRYTLLNKLKEQFGEHVVAIGINEKSMLFEVTANEKVGSFSVLLTDKDMETCLMLSGMQFGIIRSNTFPPEREARQW